MLGGIFLPPVGCATILGIALQVLDESPTTSDAVEREELTRKLTDWKDACVWRPPSPFPSGSWRECAARSCIEHEHVALFNVLSASQARREHVVLVALLRREDGSYQVDETTFEKDGQGFGNRDGHFVADTWLVCASRPFKMPYFRVGHCRSRFAQKLLRKRDLLRGLAPGSTSREVPSGCWNASWRILRGIGTPPRFLLSPEIGLKALRARLGRRSSVWCEGLVMHSGALRAHMRMCYFSTPASASCVNSKKGLLQRDSFVELACTHRHQVTSQNCKRFQVATTLPRLQCQSSRLSARHFAARCTRLRQKCKVPC